MRIPTKVLIVDDEKDFVEVFSRWLLQQGEKVFTARSCKEVLEILEHVAIDVVLLDMKMFKGEFVTLTQIKIMYPIVEIILLTENRSIETALEGMKLGAFDILMKPVDFEDIKLVLEKARKRKKEQEERIRQAEKKILILNE